MWRFAKMIRVFESAQVKEFDGVDDAKVFAAKRKNNFDRVVLTQEDNEGQKMVVRYVDGL